MYDKIKNILKNVNLLIVEDDESLRSVIKSSIEGYVKKVFDCKNAQEAMECFTSNDINLVVSDINMPRINGLQMASMIRQSDANVPIIFLTAYDSDENIFEAIELGSFGVLKKPFDKRELIMQMSFAVNKFKNDFADIDLKNGFRFNALSKELTCNGAQINLTKKEQNLLHLFLRNKGKMVSFGTIENYVWCGESCTSDAIRSFVYKLSKKLYPELIENCQGSGYKLNLSNDPSVRTVTSIQYI